MELTFGKRFNSDCISKIQGHLITQIKKFIKNGFYVLFLDVRLLLKEHICIIISERQNLHSSLQLLTGTEEGEVEEADMNYEDSE